MRALALLALLTACPSSLDTSAQALASTPWTRHTIASDLLGADGHALGDVDHDGDADVAVAWEESSRITVYARPADPRVTPWPLVGSYAHSSAEDVALCDLDADGWLDLVSAGEDRKLRVARNLGGTFAAAVVVGAATNVQQWTQVVCGGELGELVAGGRIASAGQTLGIYALHSATPWVAASWTRELLGPAGWTMTLALQDVDGDGLTDVLTSDRLQAAPAVQGTRYLTRAGGAWASVWLQPITGGCLPRFVDRRWGSGRLLVGCVVGQSSSLTLDGVALPYPAGLGVYQAGRVIDVDADGREDVVLTSGEYDGVLTPEASSGVVWLHAPDWGRREVSGSGGGKWDEVDTWDVDADGDLDVVTTEQRDGLGVVWFEQPSHSLLCTNSCVLVDFRHGPDRPPRDGSPSPGVDSGLVKIASHAPAPP